jgi:hypothetical protein
VRYPSDFLQDVLHSLDQSGSILYERMAALIATGNDIPRDRADAATLLERHPGGDERPALVCGLHHHHGKRKAADETVSQGKMVSKRLGPRR